MERVVRWEGRSISVYDEDGRDAALANANAMAAGGLEYSFVLDRETPEMVAHGQNPRLAGSNFGEVALDAFLPASKIGAELHNDGGATFAYRDVLDPSPGSVRTKAVLFRMHDGCAIAAGQPLVVYAK